MNSHKTFHDIICVNTIEHSEQVKFFPSMGSNMLLQIDQQNEILQLLL